MQEVISQLTADQRKFVFVLSSEQTNVSSSGKRSKTIKSAAWKLVIDSCSVYFSTGLESNNRLKVIDLLHHIEYGTPAHAGDGVRVCGKSAGGFQKKSNCFDSM